MATVNGAKALGLEEQLGSLKVGKRGDVVLVDLKKPHSTPVYDPIVNLVYFSQGSDVDTVIVDGKIVVEEGVVKTVDEDYVLHEVLKAKDSLVESVS